MEALRVDLIVKVSHAGVCREGLAAGALRREVGIGKLLMY